MKSILVAFIGFIIFPSALAENNPKIIGGRDAEPHEFPFMVHISMQTKFFCGGTFLSELFILTAAHCLIFAPADLLITAGKNNLSVVEQTEQIRYAAKCIVHQEFENDDLSSPDIGLIKLDKPLDFTGAVKPIDVLPKKNAISRGHGIIIGWGSTTDKLNPEYSQFLQKAIVPILPNDICAEAWKENVNYTDIFLCTGPFPGIIGGCDGDSGGPLLQSEAGITTVIGIASYVKGNCETKRGPTVFIRTSAFINWINKNIK